MKQSKSEEKNVQLAKGAFIINDFLRNPHFSKYGNFDSFDSFDITGHIYSKWGKLGLPGTCNLSVVAVHILKKL